MNSTDPLEDLAWLWFLLVVMAVTCVPMLVFAWWERKHRPERFEHESDHDYDDSRDCCGGGVQEEWR